ncbi:MAG: cytochrome ubiquinol oxidase subunit I [Phycisphaerales bacterium]|nr:cytochrome ubiquinol oxidase subunit I [Phycisphaerales bacterium]
MDVVFLSRLQFALTVMFHYLFPPLTIGLGLLIVIYEIIHYRTRDAAWQRAVDFWVRLFAVSFAVGVASGIVMEFQFGTNWAVYSRFVGDVFGSALAAEGIFAFFLESGFLAVLVFGRGRVSRRFYLFSTIMVSLGSIFSSVWITVANSWQQTPAGAHVVQMRHVDPATGEMVPWFVDGEPVMRAEITDFWQVVFNPSSLNRLTHTWTGCLILGGTFVLSICGWYVLRGRHLDFARRCMPAALVCTLVGTVSAAITGDLNARMVAEHQPAKLAAMEAHYTTGDGPTGLTLFGLPDATGEHVAGRVEIPGLLTMLVHHELSPKTPVTGLDRIPPDDRPPVRIPFYMFRLMVLTGILLMLISLVALVYWWRGKLVAQRWLMVLFVISVFGGFVANEAGWIVAEVGRQPWIVQPPILRSADGAFKLDENGYVQYAMVDLPAPDGGISGQRVAGLRTEHAASEAVKGGEVLASIIIFGLIYGLLFLVWAYVLDAKIGHGPEADGEHGGPGGFLAVVTGETHGSRTGMRDPQEPM